MAVEKPQPREARGGKVSIYWAAPLGTRPVEAVEWRATIAPVSVNGQRTERPIVEYRLPKKRKWEQAPIEVKAVTVLVLEGWGHGGPRTFTEERRNGFVCQTGLYACYDPRWTSDYFDWADQYIALHASADNASARVLADYRGWVPS